MLDFDVVVGARQRQPRGRLERPPTRLVETTHQRLEVDRRHLDASGRAVDVRNPAVSRRFHASSGRTRIGAIAGAVLEMYMSVLYTVECLSTLPRRCRTSFEDEADGHFARGVGARSAARADRGRKPGRASICARTPPPNRSITGCATPATKVGRSSARWKGRAARTGSPGGRRRSGEPCGTSRPKRSVGPKDLEIAAWLTEALLRDGGLAGLAAGVGLMAGLVEAFWDELYPLPDEEGMATSPGPRRRAQRRLGQRHLDPAAAEAAALLQTRRARRSSCGNTSNRRTSPRSPTKRRGSVASRPAPYPSRP